MPFVDKSLPSGSPILLDLHRWNDQEFQAAFRYLEIRTRNFVNLEIDRRELKRSPRRCLNVGRSGSEVTEVFDTALTAQVNLEVDFPSLVGLVNNVGEPLEGGRSHVTLVEYCPDMTRLRVFEDSALPDVVIPEGQINMADRKPVPDSVKPAL